MTQPIPGEILYTEVTLAGSRSLSGTFFWLIITAADLDLTPIVVIPEELIALNAYSIIKNDLRRSYPLGRDDLLVRRW